MLQLKKWIYLHCKVARSLCIFLGDQGSGNISGGRYSIDALIRGEYLNTSKNITDYSYPRYITTANTNAGSLSSVTSSQSILNAPSQAINHSKGDTGKATVGLSAQGMGNYQNETLVSNPRDVSYLQNLIQSFLELLGVGRSYIFTIKKLFRH